MERMIKRIAIRKDGTISMSEYRNFAEKYQGEIDKLEEENKKLNIKVASLEGEIKGLNSVIDKLKEENQTLELWLDNKEKVNESLREELGWYKTEHERLVDKLVIKGATELLDREFENKKGWQGE